MAIEISNKTRERIPSAKIKRLAGSFLDYYRLTGKDLSLVFVGDRTMARLNGQYRHSQAPTDVLSFTGEDDFFGEIIIDYAQIKRQAGNYGQSANQELYFILVHGLLHLLGDDDNTEKKRLAMIKKGEALIKKLAY